MATPRGRGLIEKIEKIRTNSGGFCKYLGLGVENQKSKSAVPDGKALSFARTQLGHHVSLLIGSDFIS